MRSGAALILLVATALGTLIGCDRSPGVTEPAKAAGQSTVATAEDAGVSLEVTTDATEIATTDRLRVTIGVIRRAGEPVTLTEPDWGGAGWSLVDTVDSQPRPAGEGLIERSRTVVLEPFLDGSYEIPPVSVSWDTDGRPRTLASQPLSVSVTSVLVEDDDGGIAPPAPAVEPAEPDAPGWRAGAVAAAVLLSAAVAGFLIARPRSGIEPAPPEPMEVLRSEAASTAGGAEAIARVHRALGVLAGDDTRRSEALAPLIGACERARFAPGGAEADAAAIAREALRLLEAPR